MCSSVGCSMRCEGEGCEVSLLSGVVVCVVRDGSAVGTLLWHREMVGRTLNAVMDGTKRTLGTIIAVDAEKKACALPALIR